MLINVKVVLSWTAVLLAWLSTSDGQEEEARSVLSTIFETLSSSSTSSTCPGRCFNAIAAMACRAVIDDPGACTQPGFRCCKNIASEDDEAPKLSTASTKEMEAEAEPLATSERPKLIIDENDRKPSRLQQLMNERQPDQSRVGTGTVTEIELESPSERSDLIQYPPLSRVEVCPGVCVAKRISNFCEAAIDAKDLCKKELRCCVPSNLFDGVTNVPREFVILNPISKNETVEESRSEMTKAPNFSTQEILTSTKILSTTPSTTTTATITTTMKRTSSIPFNEGNKKYPPSSNPKSGLELNDDIPPARRCRGTCVAGFFAFLCDSVDRTGECPRSGKCCMSPSKQNKLKERPKPNFSQNNENAEGSRIKESQPKPHRPLQSATTTTSTTPRTTTPLKTFSTKPVPPPCTGTCLPVSLASRCRAPSRLVVASGCNDDEICCDNHAKSPNARPGANVPQALGTLLSLFGGGQKDRAPPPPRRRITTTTTTTTTTPTTTEAVIIPDCPGTCISPILSFTCFGNAEISELFKCNKEKQSCCAPKSAIKILNRKQEIQNIARNDTVFTPAFNYNYNQPPFINPPFEQPSYPENPYDRPNFIQPPFGQPPQREKYPPSYYHPPPPPPSHIIPQTPPHMKESSYVNPPPPPPPPYQPSHFQTPSNNPQSHFQTPSNNPQSFNQYDQLEPEYPDNTQSEYPDNSSPEYHEGLKPVYPNDAHSGYPGGSHSGFISGTQSEYPVDVHIDYGGITQTQFPAATQVPTYHPPESSSQAYQPRPVYEQKNTFRYTYSPPTLNMTPLSTPAPAAVPVNTSHLTSKYVCGIKGTSRGARVVGGEDSVPGEWCWQVALINSLNQYLCGGALIGSQWVVTAAHCVTNIVRSGDAIYVRVGDHDLTTRLGSPSAQTIPVATTYIHHNHNSQTLDNDIALLKLSSATELGNGVCLVCLPARGVSQVAGKRCTVTGYGYMGETGPIPLRIREAEIPVVSENECIRKINAVTEKVFILPASSFCAGGENGHDACQGDGGGPLVCQVDNYYELSGLVSWGFGCGRQDVPGVYVKVSSFIGWINQIISVNNT